MKNHLKAVNEIQNEIRLRRPEKSYTSLSDITRVLHAQETTNWNEVYSSRLYRLHGGEYCELLSVIHRYMEEKIVS
jgi:hypothetical protein